MVWKARIRQILRSPKKISLRWLLVIPFLVQLVSAVGLVSYLSLRNEHQAIESLAYQLTEKVNDSVRSQVGSYLKTPHLLNQTSRNLIEQGTLRSPEEIQPFLVKQLRTLDAIDYMAWGDRQGNYLDVMRLPNGGLTTSLVDASTNHQFYTYRVNPEGQRDRLLQNSGPYDPRTRPWYQAALKQRGATWSPIYVWFDHTKLAIDAVMPVYDATGREWGVLDIPVTLSQLSDFLNQLSTEQAGQYFIVESSGALVATSTAAKLWRAGQNGQPQRQLAAESDIPLIRASWQQLNDRAVALSSLHQPIQRRFNWQGQRQYLQASPIRAQGIDWLMVVVVPESSFMDQVNANTRSTVSLSLIALAIATGAAILTAKWITRPILQLNASAKRFVRRFGASPSASSTNEVEELATSFQSISEQLQISLLALQHLNTALEQRVAERTQELAQVTDRFETFMNHSPVCAWITDADSKVLYVNQPYLRTFQLASSEIIGKTVFELYDAEVAQAAFISTQSVAQTQQGLEAIATVPRRDGTAGEFLVYKFPITGASGQTWVGGVALDITERRQMEAALRASEARSSRLAAIVESSRDAILSKDLEGTILSWNAGAERLFGYTAEEAIGRSIAILTPPERMGDMAQDLQKIRQDDIKDFETERIRKDGQRLDVSMTVSPLKDKNGQIIAISAIYRDITERKQAEVQLRNLSDRLTLALQSSAIGTWDWDFIHEVRWDASMYDLYGFQSADRVAQYQDWVNALHPDDRVATEAALQAAIRGEKEFDVEFRIFRTDGALRFIKASAVIQRNPQGEPQRMIGINYDITERRQAEQTLRENEQFLRSIYNGVDQAIFVMDVRENGDFCFVGLNPAHERLSGLRSIDLQGKTPEQSLPPEIAMAVRQRYQACLDIGATVTYEECLPFQGQLSWWMTSLTPLRNEQFRIYRIVGTSININARKQAEKQLELQDKIVKTMAEGVCLVRETDGEIVYANPKFEQMFGYEPGELIGQAVSIVNYQDDTTDAQAVASEIMTAIARFGEHTYEIKNVKKDGTPFWCRATSSQFDHPEHGIVYVAVHEDITQRKALEQELMHQRYLLEQELAHNRQLLDAFITSAPVGMCVLDSQLRYTLVNEALADNNGIAAADHLGKTIWEIVPDIASEQVDVLQRVLTTGEAILGAEVVGETLKYPGVQRTWLVSHFPIVTPANAMTSTPAGKINGADSLGLIITEITERKRAEEQIRASLKEKEVLLQEIHHRVKNNLQIVDSLLQMQQRRTPNPQAANILLESQHRIKSIALVHEKLYRSEDLANINFADYVHNLTSNLLDSYQMSTHPVHLKTDVAAIDLDIDTAIPCGLIINELVTNALKYAFPEGRSGQIAVKFHISEPGWLLLSVQDDGIGIAETVDLQKTRSLGLKMVRTLASQLEGTVEIERSQGTLIRVRFPQKIL